MCMQKLVKTGWTPLHEAASSGTVELAALLLEHGAHINAINKPQEPGVHIPEEPPLHVAARKDHLPMVQFLIERGADINQLRVAPNVISVLHNALQTHQQGDDTVSFGAWCQHKKSGSSPHSYGSMCLSGFD